MRPETGRKGVWRQKEREQMSVNGVTSTQAAAAYSYSALENKAAEDTKNTEAAEKEKEDSGVIYEPSTEAQAAASTKKTYTPDTNLINKLKADAEARTAQLRSLVEKMMSGQANTYGKANDTVDPATKLQAQADIAEDGYWGVEQTSDRIIDFANALTGGDPDKIEEMRDAFKKGYKQAEKTWGGSLPDISKRTYDAVMKRRQRLPRLSRIQRILPSNFQGSNKKHKGCSINGRNPVRLQPLFLTSVFPVPKAAEERHSMSKGRRTAPVSAAARLCEWRGLNCYGLGGTRVSRS